ncbi:Hypothetical predicted protein, partial [Marmota monax]
APRRQQVLGRGWRIGQMDQIPEAETHAPQQSCGPTLSMRREPSGPANFPVLGLSPASSLRGTLENPENRLPGARDISDLYGEGGKTLFLAAVGTSRARNRKATASLARVPGGPRGPGHWLLGRLTARWSGGDVLRLLLLDIALWFRKLFFCGMQYHLFNVVTLLHIW